MQYPDKLGLLKSSKFAEISYEKGLSIDFTEIFDILEINKMESVEQGVGLFVVLFFFRHCGNFRNGIGVLGFCVVWQPRNHSTDASLRTFQTVVAKIPIGVPSARWFFCLLRFS